jgi:hypothetical protein
MIYGATFASPMRSPPTHSALHAPAAPGSYLSGKDDPLTQASSLWFEENLLRGWPRGMAVPGDGLGSSFLRVVLVFALLGALAWAVVGYGAYRLIAG